MKNKNYSEAIRVYDRAITVEPDYFEAWNGKADALNRAQKFTEALEASDRVLVLKPDYVQGWINRGYILYNLGRYDEELKAYETAITLDPASPAAWFNKGYSLAGMKRYDEAIAAFNKVQALDPAFPNLAANIRIAEQNRNATTSFNASERTPSTIPTQSQIKTSPTLPVELHPQSLPNEVPTHTVSRFCGRCNRNFFNACCGTTDWKKEKMVIRLWRNGYLPVEIHSGTMKIDQVTRIPRVRASPRHGGAA